MPPSLLVVTFESTAFRSFPQARTPSERSESPDPEAVQGARIDAADGVATSLPTRVIGREIAL